MRVSPSTSTTLAPLTDHYTQYQIQYAQSLLYEPSDPQKYSRLRQPSIHLVPALCIWDCIWSPEYLTEVVLTMLLSTRIHGEVAVVSRSGCRSRSSHLPLRCYASVGYVCAGEPRSGQPAAHRSL